MALRISGDGSLNYLDATFNNVTASGLSASGNVVLPSTTEIGAVSSTELGYVDGVTSAIQTQVDGKVSTTGSNSNIVSVTNNERALTIQADSSQTSPVFEILSDNVNNVFIKGQDNTNLILQSSRDNLNSQPQIQFYKSAGTIDSPSAVSDGENIGSIVFRAWDGSNFSQSALILAETDGDVSVGDTPGKLSFYTTPDGSSAYQERMLIDNQGRVGIGNSTPTNLLGVGTSDGVSNAWIAAPRSGNSIEWGHNNPAGYRSTLGAFSGGGQNFIAFNAEHGTNANTFRTRGVKGGVIVGHNGWFYWYTADNSNADNQNLTLRMRLNSSGDLLVNGALSKGSGSFKIDHPLKPETHHLVHSFIEGPKADLIYSGMISLVNGSAEVNIDQESGMTEGTFVALTRNHRRMTTNESGFTPIKSELNGNILTITAQDSDCNDEVYWQVIGERQDIHMFETDWTDENGRVIVEPVKETEEENSIA